MVEAKRKGTRCGVDGWPAVNAGLEPEEVIAGIERDGDIAKVDHRLAATAAESRRALEQHQVETPMFTLSPRNDDSLSLGLPPEEGHP